MLKASSLYIVIIISLILSVVSSALIMTAYYYRLALIDKNIDERLERNLYSAVNILLSESGQEQSQVIDLYGEETDSVYCSSKTWGVFNLFTVQSFSGKRIRKKAFLAGAALEGKFASALYLVDLNRPISVCGKTLLKGPCYLPKAGVERAYIAGKSFTGNKLVDGKILESEATLPEIKNKEAIKSLYQSREEYKKIAFSDLDIDQALYNSFSDSTIYIHSEFPINLSANLSGNIIVYSGSEVHIASSSKLYDVLVVSPYIKIVDHFEGNLQLFATDSVHIGKHSKLKYPSAVTLLQKANPVANSAILIEEFAQISGVIMALKQQQSKYDCNIKINPNAGVYGQVYSEGFADVQGTIKGNLTANKVIFNNAYSTYVNHFMDATIDYSALSSHFAGTYLFSENNPLKVIKWLE